MRIDSAVSVLLALLLALPFGQVFVVKTPFAIFNCFELIYLAVAALLCLRCVAKQGVRHAKPAVILGSTLAVYVLEAFVTQSSQTSFIISQLRTFVPFAVATLLLVAGTTLTTKRFFACVLSVSIISSGAAIIVQYFAPQILFENAPLADIGRIAEGGRLYWKNDCVLLFIPLFFMMRRSTTTPRMIALALVALSVTLGAEVLSGNRTVILGLSAMLVGGCVVMSKLRWLRRAVIGVGLLAVIFVAARHMDSRVDRLIETRYVGGTYGLAKVYSDAVEVNRIPLYVQYMADVVRSFPLGLGLGRPYAASSHIEAYITDVSLFSFVLPFGVFGFVTLSVFLRELYGLLKRYARRAGRQEVRGTKLLLLVSLLMSLNVDLYSRDNFVIAVSMLILTFANSRGTERVAVTSEGLVRRDVRVPRHG